MFLAVKNAPVAQLDRVFGYEPKGRGFESLPAYHVGTSYACSDFFFIKNQSPASLSLLFSTKPMGFCGSPAALAGANPHLLYRLSPTPLQSSAPYSKASQQLILPRSPVINYRFYQVIAISVFSGLSAVPIIGVAVSSAESAFISSAVRAKSKISIFSFILSVCTDFGITETPF